MEKEIKSAHNKCLEIIGFSGLIIPIAKGSGKVPALRVAAKS
jgi:hypothetical protein